MIPAPGAGVFETADRKQVKRLRSAGIRPFARVRGEGSPVWRFAAQPVMEYLNRPKKNNFNHPWNIEARAGYQQHLFKRRQSCR
jgi:hypothetical protein